MGQNVGIGTSNPSSLLSVGSNSQFQVSSTGDIKKINGIDYSFPVVNPTNISTLTHLNNNTLKWLPTLPVGTIVYSQSINPMFDSLGYQLAGYELTGDLVNFAGYKNGYWVDSLIYNSAPSPKSNIIFTNTFNEFAYYDSGRIYLRNLLGATFQSLFNFSLPNPYRDNVSLAFDKLSNKIFLFGGRNILNGNAAHSAFTYDVANNSWSAMANPPDSLEANGTCIVDSILYVFGGRRKPFFDFITNMNIYKYNINTNTWETLSNAFHLSFDAYVCASAGKNIYLTPARSTTMPTPSPFLVIKFNTTNNVFDYVYSVRSDNHISSTISYDNLTNKLWGITAGDQGKFYSLDTTISPSPSHEVYPVNALAYLNATNKPLACTWIDNNFYVYGGGQVLKIFTPSIGQNVAVFGEKSGKMFKYVYIKIR